MLSIDFGKFVIDIEIVVLDLAPGYLVGTWLLTTSCLTVVGSPGLFSKAQHLLPVTFSRSDGNSSWLWTIEPDFVSGGLDGILVMN